MKRLGLTGLAILTMYAASMIASSSAGAVCAVVKTLGAGNYTNALCVVLGGTKEYILVTLLGSSEVELGFLCAKVEEAGTGTFTEELCANTVGAKEWIKILRSLAQCPRKGGLVSLCIEKVEGSKELTRESGTYGFSGTLAKETESLIEVPGLELHVVCTAVEDAGSFEQPTEVIPVTIDKQSILFKSCSVLAPLGEKCKVKEPIELNETDGAFNEALTEVSLEPETGTTLGTMTIESVKEKSCTIAATDKITGKQSCKVLEAETDAVAHLIECTEAGSKELLVAEKEAKLLLVEEAKLTGTEAGKKWSIAPS